MTPLSIIALEINDFMRISAVKVKTNGSSLIQITGRNAEGKSSVINAIWAALQWRTATGSIPEPIRRGQESAKVRIDLGDLIITRTWKGEKSSLTVTTREGAKYPSPQSILDKLVSEIGFDPLEFTRMQPKDQRQTLMNLLKIDFSQYDQERSDLLREKGITAAQVISLTQQLRDVPQVSEDIPDEEISAGEILKEIQECQEILNQHDRKTHERIGAKRNFDETSVQIHELEKELEYKRGVLSRQEAIVQTLDIEISSTVLPDIKPLQDKLSNIETMNKQVRLKQQKYDVLTKLQQAEKTVYQITDAIKDIDQDKRDSLESAQFPVPGLSFDESGILLNGVPFAQASTAEQIRVSLAMGIALNPDLRVLLIRDGNALDSSSMAIVSQMAVDENMQIWMERVDESGVCGVVIEDGTVKSYPVAPGQQVIA